MMAYYSRFSDESSDYECDGGGGNPYWGPPSGWETPATDGPFCRVYARSLYRLEFDGASKGNPGCGGCGALLVEDRSGYEVGFMRHYLDHCTNNEAEYHALIEGLRMALDYGVHNIIAQGDSQLVVNQMLGIWKARKQHMVGLRNTALDLSEQFCSFGIRHVERHYNQAADNLANDAICAAWEHARYRR